MAKGAYVVSRHKDNARDIHFRVRDDGVGEIPEDQADLHAEVASALTVLNGIFKEADARFERYFAALLALAQAGLVGPAAQPKVARQALQNWKADVVAAEAGRIKSGYMVKLARQAALLGVPALALGGILWYWPSVRPATGFLFLWAGSMAGVWLSFGTRRVLIPFDELHVLEDDRLEPTIRLAFAGLLTQILGLLFHTGAVSLSLGDLSLGTFAVSPTVALLLGALAGLGEKTLPSKLSSQAAAVLGQSP